MYLENVYNLETVSIEKKFDIKLYNRTLIMLNKLYI